MREFTHSTITLRLQERSPFFDRALLQALFWSLIFHLALFSSFRIRLNDYQESSPQMLPLDVAIDADKFDEAKIVATTVDSQLANPSDLFCSNIDPEEYKAMNLALLPTAESRVNDDDIASQSAPLIWAPKMYPLQLKLSPQLKDLALLDDGSSLFRKKSPYDTLGRFVLTSNHLPIEYKVYVNGLTGRIDRAEREQVLLDKRLQAIGDRLISQVKFKPFSEKNVTGSITLIFCCTGDEIKSLMND